MPGRYQVYYDVAHTVGTFITRFCDIFAGKNLLNIGMKPEGKRKKIVLSFVLTLDDQLCSASLSQLGPVQRSLTDPREVILDYGDKNSVTSSSSGNTQMIHSRYLVETLQSQLSNSGTNRNQSANMNTLQSTVRYRLQALTLGRWSQVTRESAVCSLINNQNTFCLTGVSAHLL